MNRIACIGIALSLLVASGASGQGILHDFRVTESRIVLPVEPSTRVLEHGSTEGRAYWILTPLRADRVRLVSHGWNPDPIFTELRLEQLRGDTVRIAVLVGSSPRCKVLGQLEGSTFVLRGFLREPATADYYLRAGEYFAATGNHRRAIDQFRKALALDPSDLRPFLAAARSRMALGQRKLAAFNARRALADPSLHEQAAEILRALGRSNETRIMKAGGERLPERQVNDRIDLETGTVTATDSQKTAEETVRAPGKPKEEGGSARPAVLSGSPEEVALPWQGVESGRFALARTLVLSLLLTACIVVPFGLVLLRFRKPRSRREERQRSESSMSDFERAKNDVFEYLLRESMHNSEGSPAEREEAVELPGSAPASRLDIPKDSESGIHPRNAAAGEEEVLPERRESSHRAFRGEVESIHALAARGLTVPEIARRLGLGKEEVRLALQVRRGTIHPLIRRSRKPHFELVEEL